MTIAPRTPPIYIYIYIYVGGVRGTMVIIVGNSNGDTTSNPGRVCLHFKWFVKGKNLTFLLSAMQ